MNDWKRLKKKRLEAPPLPEETTQNLQTPEVLGDKIDKRTLRKTGRTEQFATRVSKEWLVKIRKIAERENLKLVEVLEKMLERYESQQENTTKKVIKKLNDENNPDLFCSFRTATNPEICLHLVFDKKKQLCRTHNRQVRNRFNQFTKDMSISSTAAWEMQWEQSNDWRYFWDLVKG